MNKTDVKISEKRDPDKEIISKIKEGVIEDFRLIMKKYNQRLYRIALSFGISDFDADDILQQTYISAYKNLNSFNEDSAFLTWLTKILINECLMYKRKQKSLSRQLTEPLHRNIIMKELNPEEDYMKTELKNILENSILKLPEKYRNAYMIREVEGISTKESAEILGISEENLKIRLYRSKALLREYLLSSFNKKELFNFGNTRCDRVADNVMKNLRKK